MATNIDKFQPKDLEDAISFVLENAVNEESKEFFDKHENDERGFVGELHHFFGQNLRNSWYLWWFANHKYETWPAEKPLIVEWFNRHDIYHADDMSSIILTSTHRRYFNKPIELDKQIERFHKFWLKSVGNINPMSKEVIEDEE